MSNPLCLLLLATLYWQHASSRYVGQQPLNSPYSDYSYSYTGPTSHQSPFHHQPYHSPLFTPPGTYFDQRQGILRPFPGGGVPVLVDYHKRCSNQYVGLKAHPDQQQYYYVCKPDCVIFGRCQNLQIFNATSKQCVQHPPPEYIPICTSIGRFPLFSDCHLYYKCGDDLEPKIYSCPAAMVFSPVTRQCINGNKCTPTQISPHSSYMPEYCASKFPPCFENGIFRSPSDCSLYYKCDLKKNNVYVQTRLRCPQGNFYDLQKHECLPAKLVACDSIQVAELVYPKSNAIPFQPAVYPSQYDFNSLEDSQYPLEKSEKSREDKLETINSCNISKSDEEIKGEITTTLMPTAFETTKLRSKVFVLDNFINTTTINKSDNFESEELQELTKTLHEAAISSEEIISKEDSDPEEQDSEETTPSQENENTTGNLNQDTMANVLEEREGEAQTTTTSESSKELEDAFGSLIEEEEVLKNTKTMEPKEEAIVGANLPANFSQSEHCANVLEDNEINDETLPTDTQTKLTSQTQNQKCLPKLAITKSNTGPDLTKATDVSENTRGSRSTLHENNSTTITRLVSTLTTTQLPTRTLSATSSRGLKAIQLSNETELVSEKNKLAFNFLDPKTNLEMETATEQALRLLKTEIELTTSKTFSQHTRLVKDAALSEDRAILDTEPTLASLTETSKELIVENIAPKNTINTKVKSDTTQKSDNAITQRKSKVLTRPTNSFGNKSLNTQSRSRLIQATQTTSDNSLELITDNEASLLDTEIEIDDMKNVVKTEESSNENFAQGKPNQKQKSATSDLVDFRDEELIPVMGKSAFMNESPEQTTDLNLIAKEFDDDYTTILADKETATQAAALTDVETTITTKNTRQQQTAKTFQQLRREPKKGNHFTTNLRRRQTLPDKNIQLSTATPPIQISLTAERFATTTITIPTATTAAKENSADVDFHDDVSGVLDSKVVIHNKGEEVSNNKITSAVIIPRTSNSNRQLPHTANPTLTPTQKPTKTNKFTKKNTSPKNSKTIKSASKSNEKQHSNTLVLHVRPEGLEQPRLDSLSNKRFYYILKTKPVINNNDKSKNKSVAAASSLIKDENSRKHIPRLEIIAEQPIDVHFSICPSTSCDQKHKQNLSMSGKRAVLLKWFDNKSKQTLGFETANESNSTDIKDS